MKKSIGIIGCGWLGKKLKEQLSNSFDTECYKRKTTDTKISFWQRDIIIIAINTKNNYLQTLKKFSKLISNKTTIILMSSTSVYREFDEEVNEDAIITEIALQREAEILMQDLNKNLIILRLGGLMGEDRISGRWKSASSFCDSYVNYIHRDDVIAITKELIAQDIVSGIYNLVAPLHPLRSDVHKKNSLVFGFELGTFEGKSHRIVNSQKIIDELNYTFLHPDPLKFWD
ncbi:hypothetical protein M947_05555 [Sulfurimonas hongkongensis]|uniref:Uncharacterized protein n=1 Tax=Sulfurimonas hongkongensis TaxID=1172190 RepID=T0KQW7_9BACT|nr:hypothetical protein [Sulfurimonas hongkongensis]EQB39459.1 hypothetical protein M947_05555 [Sulfurimonas hongkongensis]